MELSESPKMTLVYELTEKKKKKRKKTLVYDLGVITVQLMAQLLIADDD